MNISDEHSLEEARWILITESGLITTQEMDTQK